MARNTRTVIGAVAATSLALAAVVLFSCVRTPPHTHPPAKAVGTAPEPFVARPARVLLVNQQPTATFTATAPYRVVAVARHDTPLLARGDRLAPSALRPSERGIHLGTHTFVTNELRIESTRDGTLGIGARRYRGVLHVIRHSPQSLSVVNVIPVESYLYSVLGSEAYAAWPPAALEAQAVVARTYALWRLADRKHRAFDLRATVNDQNYMGVEREDPRLRSAVDRTTGLVLLYQMKLFRCYYHSTCGGHTEAVENVFPDAPLLPLSGVACRHCGGSKHYRWRRVLAKTALAHSLRRDGVPITALASLEVASRTRSGRAHQMTIATSGGATLKMLASKFRVAIGPRTLPSTWFEVRDLGDRYEFRGRGWGHGVGMCQWGAKGMADAGFSATEILRHYYTGATIERLYARDAALTTRARSGADTPRPLAAQHVESEAGFDAKPVLCY